MTDSKQYGFSENLLRSHETAAGTADAEKTAPASSSDAEKTAPASSSRDDESFRITFEDVEREMRTHVERNPDIFRGKTVLLPCDDPDQSGFTQYFMENFGRLGLKKLISTCSDALRDNEMTALKKFLSFASFEDAAAEQTPLERMQRLSDAKPEPSLPSGPREVDMQTLLEHFHENMSEKLNDNSRMRLRLQKGEYELMKKSGSSPLIQKLYKEMRRSIGDLPSVKVVPNALYVSFFQGSSLFAAVEFQKAKMRLYLCVPKGKLKDSNGIARDITQIGHRIRSSDYDVYIGDAAAAEAAMSLVMQARAWAMAKAEMKSATKAETFERQTNALQPAKPEVEEADAGFGMQP